MRGPNAPPLSSVADETQQAEADQMLRSMLDVPDGGPEQRPERSAALAHSLGMLWLLDGEPEKVRTRWASLTHSPSHPRMTRPWLP